MFFCGEGVQEDFLIFCLQDEGISRWTDTASFIASILADALLQPTVKRNCIFSNQRHQGIASLQTSRRSQRSKGIASLPASRLLCAGLKELPPHKAQCRTASFAMCIMPQQINNNAAFLGWHDCAMLSTRLST